MRRPARSLWIGIAFSLGVHGVALWWLAGVTLVPRPRPPPPGGAPTEVAVVLLPGPPRATPAALPERPRRTDRAPPRERQRASPEAHGAASRTRPPVPGEAAGAPPGAQGLSGGRRVGEAATAPPGAQGPSGPGGRVGADAPLAGPGLFNPQVKVGSGNGTFDEVAPSVPVDPRTLYEARSRFEAATSSLGASLQKGVEGGALPGDPGGRLALAQLAEALAPGKFRDPRPARRPDPVADPAVSTAGGAGDLLRKREALLRLRAIADGPIEPLFRVRVEVLRRADVAGPVVRLLQPSGSAEFDLYVLGLAREWLRTRQTLEADGFFSDLTRCVLEVAAYTSFRHDLASIRPEDLPGLAATTAVTGLGQGGTTNPPRREGDELEYLGSRGLVGAAATFTFDDTTGKVEIVNLAKPRYRIQVAVLEAR